MAAYREHVSFSGVLGVCYGIGATYAFGFTPVQGALAGCLTWVAGMLPDLDSDSGKPVREIFSLAGAIMPLVLMPCFLRWTGSLETSLLLAVVSYATIRYGGALALGKLSVHRGMFHSIPALLISAELTFLIYQSGSLRVRLLMAGGVGVGFLSHLLLDEIYSVEWTGIRIKLNSSAGSAMKFFGRKLFPNLWTYSLLALLTYVSLVTAGVVDEPRINGTTLPFRQAVGEARLLR